MTENPFIGLDKAVLDIIEQLLADVYACGEWSDSHEAQLDLWRAAQGDTVKTGWRWWVGEVDGDSYSHEADSRDDAIRVGNLDFNDDMYGRRFRIVEARVWNDSVKEGEDVTPFAETRNAEIVECGQ